MQKTLTNFEIARHFVKSQSSAWCRMRRTMSRCTRVNITSLLPAVDGTSSSIGWFSSTGLPRLAARSLRRNLRLPRTLTTVARFALLMCFFASLTARCHCAFLPRRLFSGSVRGLAQGAEQSSEFMIRPSAGVTRRPACRSQTTSPATRRRNATPFPWSSKPWISTRSMRPSNKRMSNTSSMSLPGARSCRNAHFIREPWRTSTPSSIRAWVARRMPSCWETRTPSALDRNRISTSPKPPCWCGPSLRREGHPTHSVDIYTVVSAPDERYEAFSRGPMGFAVAHEAIFGDRHDRYAGARFSSRSTCTTSGDLKTPHMRVQPLSAATFIARGKHADAGLVQIEDPDGSMPNSWRSGGSSTTCYAGAPFILHDKCNMAKNFLTVLSPISWSTLNFLSCLLNITQMTVDDTATLRKSFSRPTQGGQPWWRRVCEEGLGFQSGHCRHASICAGCPHGDGRTTQVPSISQSAGTSATWWGGGARKMEEVSGWGLLGWRGGSWVGGPWVGGPGWKGHWWGGEGRRGSRWGGPTFRVFVFIFFLCVFMCCSQLEPNTQDQQQNSLSRTSTWLTYLKRKTEQQTRQGKDLR